MTIKDPNTQEVLAGDLYLNLKDPTTGNYLGQFGPLNADEMVFDSETEDISQTSRMKSTYGQTRAKLTQKVTAKLSIKLLDQPLLVKGLAYLGLIEEVSEAGGAVTDEAVTVGEIGNSIALAGRNLAAASVTVTNVGATVTYTEDDDYIVNYELGWIKFLSGTNTLALGDAVLVDYTTETVSGYRVRGNTNTQVECGVFLDGINKMRSDAPVRFNAPEVQFTPSGGSNLLGGEFTETTLEGEMITPGNATEPFTLDYIE